MEHTDIPQPKSAMHETILERIRTDAVTQLPKTHFIFKMGVTIVVAIITLLISISIFNFIFFSLRIHGHEILLGFGSRGFWFFLMLFPWTLFISDVLLVLLLEWLLRQFRFGYRIPILYLLGVLVVLTISAGLLIDRGTPLNDRLLNQADGHHLPGPLNDFYEGMRMPPPPESGVCKCVITAVNGDTLTAYNKDSGTTTTYTIHVPKDGDSDVDDRTFRVGQTVFIAGDETHNVIRAFGVRHFPDLNVPRLPPIGTSTEAHEE